MLLSLYIHANNARLINQCLVTLTEYCQGPCHENQVQCYMYICLYIYSRGREPGGGGGGRGGLSPPLFDKGGLSPPKIGGCHKEHIKY